MPKGNPGGYRKKQNSSNRKTYRGHQFGIPGAFGGPQRIMKKPSRPPMTPKRKKK